MMSILLTFFALFLNSFWWAAPAGAYDFQEIVRTGVVGEAFGAPVKNEEFLYHFKTASLFTRSGGAQAERDDEDRRQEAWQNLVFVREARDSGVVVPREEVVAELKRLLFEKNVEYGTESYTRWVIETFAEDPKTFENRIADLLTINKLLKIKLDPEVTVTEEEMKEKFLNQYNSFESEYILFENDPKSAQEFAASCKKDPKLWFDTYQSKKSLGQKGASWINIMSLEALIDLWKIPKEDAYRILEGKEGDFIVAKQFYGDAVFRLLYSRKADLKEYTEAKQQYYRETLTKSKKHKQAQEYLDGLFKRANFRDFLKEKEDTAKKEQLKKKSAVVLETDAGTIELKLYPDIAPLACENFIGLAEKGYYNGLTFHRIVKDFMVQGGDPTGTGAGGESIWGDKAFADETSDKAQFDKPGVLAMANSGPDTNKSQFFITVKPTPWLNGRHTIFGEVVSGMEVVNKMNAVETQDDKPKETQKIMKVYVKP
jgi:peptidylprolyl isomerase